MSPRRFSMMWILVVALMSAPSRAQAGEEMSAEVRHVQTQGALGGAVIGGLSAGGAMLSRLQAAERREEAKMAQDEASFIRAVARGPVSHSGPAGAAEKLMEAELLKLAKDSQKTAEVHLLKAKNADHASRRLGYLSVLSFLGSGYLFAIAQKGDHPAVSESKVKQLAEQMPGSDSARSSQEQGSAAALR